MQHHHQANRARLINEGKAVIPGLIIPGSESNIKSDEAKAEMARQVTKPAVNQKEYVPEPNDAPIVKTAKPKAKKTTAKKKTAKKK